MSGIKEEHSELKINHSVYKTRLSRKFLEKKEFKTINNKQVESFIPGTVVELMVKVGDPVSVGDILVVLDAMKMKNRIKCLEAGKVKSINVKVGERVPKGRILIELE